MSRPIAISLSPNAEKKDVLLALKHIFLPWGFFSNNNVKLLEQWFRQYFKVSYAVSFLSGRAALLSILKALKIKQGDEIIIQSFTCAVVPDMIISLGAKPVYTDINNSLTMDAEDLEKKITEKTKALILQHTFGASGDLTRILRIAKKHKLYIIEDCAHGVGHFYKNKKLGTFGTASFFSFGRDKAFSSVFGGMAITNSESLGKEIRLFQKRLKNPSFFWIYQQLFHPLAFYFILPLYDFFSAGKVILFLLQKLKLLSFPVAESEKKGKININVIKKLPNPLASLALSQLKKLKQYNKKREDISSIYIKKLDSLNYIFPYKNSGPYLRFPLFTERRADLIKFLKKRKIYIGTWYSNIIDPEGSDFNRIYYKKTLCPKAEYFAKTIINLPTYPTMKASDVKKVIDSLKSFN